MHDTVNDAVNLVSALEPDRVPSTVEVYVVIDDTAPPPQATLVANHYVDHPDEDTPSGITTVPLTELHRFDLQASGPWKLRDTGIAAAVTEPELSEAMQELAELRRIRPLENDAASIVANLSDIDAVTALAGEYVEYEEQLFNQLNDSVQPTRPERYDAVLTAETRRVVVELETIRAATIGSARTLDLIARYAADTHRITRNDEPVLVALGPKRRWGSDTETADEVVAALWIALHGTEGLYSRTLTIVPRWVADLFGAAHDSYLLSTPRAPETITGPVLEIAKRLWEEADRQVDAVYAEFDVAVAAARALTER